MMTVLATWPMSCGCTEAIVDDDGHLFACSASTCKPSWWCECVDGQDDPDVCEHAELLLLEMDVA